MRNVVPRLFFSASFWALSSSILRIGGNLAVLPLALRTTPPEQMGLWYLFLAINLFTNLLEFGFSTVLSRSITYLWHGVPRLQTEGIALDAPAVDLEESSRELSRVHHVMSRFSLFTGGLSLLLLGLLLPVARHALSGQIPAQTFLIAWAIFSLASCLCLVNLFTAAFLTGINGVTPHQRIIAFSLVLNYAVAICGLQMRGGIYALCAGLLAMNIFQFILFRRFFLSFARERIRKISVRFSDYGEVLRTLWPNARRGWAINLATFFILNTGTLVSSTALGLATTASYGLTFQILMALATLSSVLIQIKMPMFNAHRAHGDLAGLQTLFVQRVRISLLIFAAGVVFLACAGEPALSLIRSQTTLLPVSQLLLLSLFIFLQLNHSFYEFLVLSENRNPFAAPYLLAGACIAALTFLLGPVWGIYGLLLPPLLVQMSFNNWWVVREGIRSLRCKPAAYLRFFFSSPWQFYTR